MTEQIITTVTINISDLLDAMLAHGAGMDFHEDGTRWARYNWDSAIENGLDKLYHLDRLLTKEAEARHKAGQKIPGCDWEEGSGDR